MNPKWAPILAVVIALEFAVMFWLAFVRVG